MNKDYENLIIDSFENLNKNSFKIQNSKNYFFICGGEVNITHTIPPSFRDRFLSYVADNNELIYNSIILAETFKDYFKENAYPDLLVFEDDIANFSTLVIIFLESPGSMVEFGMFCNKLEFYKKLIIIAPQNETNNEDSFIFLGPLENIRKKDSSSVLIYPWPNNEILEYNSDHIIDIVEIIENKISNRPQKTSFDENNTGHLALLIYQIIKVIFPVLLNEIELALLSIEIEYNKTLITRLLYLLTKFNLIKNYQYSGYVYYYPCDSNYSAISFGSSDYFDESKIRISISKFLNSEITSAKRKRKAAMLEILSILNGDNDESN